MLLLDRILCVKKAASFHQFFVQPASCVCFVVCVGRVPASDGCYGNGNFPHCQRLLLSQTARTNITTWFNIDGILRMNVALRRGTSRGHQQGYPLCAANNCWVSYLKLPVVTHYLFPGHPSEPLCNDTGLGIHLQIVVDNADWVCIMPSKLYERCVLVNPCGVIWCVFHYTLLAAIAHPR